MCLAFTLFVAVEICKYNQPGKEERSVAVKRLTSQAAVDVAQFASEANILRKLVNECATLPSSIHPSFLPDVRHCR